MSCSLDIQDLNYKDLFENLSLHISHKEKISIIGANGVGKSTLLDIVAGLEEAKYNKLEIFHTPIYNLKDFEIVRDKIGYLFQDSNEQFIAPTVIEDISFSLQAKGINQDEAIYKSIELLKEFGLEHLKNKTVFELSGGEKKLIALLGILIIKPKLMLLDEPTNGLDENAQNRLINILKNIDTTMIIVSHQQDFLLKICDKNYLLKNKKLTIVNI